MNSFKKVDLTKWTRTNHFNFFNDYANPFYNICTNIEITELLDFTRKNNLSFFLSSLFLSTKAINEVSEFKFRILNDEIIEYNLVHPFSTILNDNDTFSFCPFEFTNNFKIFITKGEEALRDIAKNKDRLDAKEYRQDVIYYSVVPWFSITGMTNPIKSFHGNSIPKIIFSKYFEENGKIKMPICLEVNHAFIDGLHIAKYLELFRSFIVRAPELLGNT